MRKHAVALMVGLLVVGLLVVGCGGDDGDDASAGSAEAETTSASADAGADGETSDDGGDAAADGDGGATITKAAFIEQADAICAESQQRITGHGTKFFKEAEQEPGKSEAEEIQVELVEVVLLPEYQRVAEELSGLELPSGDEEAAAFVSSYEGFSDTVSGDPQGYLKQGPGVESYEETKKLAKSYGFEKCPQGV